MILSLNRLSTLPGSISRVHSYVVSKPRQGNAHRATRSVLTFTVHLSVTNTKSKQAWTHARRPDTSQQPRVAGGRHESEQSPRRHDQRLVELLPWCPKRSCLFPSLRTQRQQRPPGTRTEVRSRQQRMRSSSGTRWSKTGSSSLRKTRKTSCGLLLNGSCHIVVVGVLVLFLWWHRLSQQKRAGHKVARHNKDHTHFTDEGLQQRRKPQLSVLTEACVILHVFKW